MRMFAAVVPPEPAIADLDDFLEVRRAAAEPQRFRWTLAEQFHVTLAFAAAVPDRSLDEWVERLERAARRRTAFEAVIAGGGAFPNVARAKVLYADLALDEAAHTELDRLATGAKAAATKSGIEVDPSTGSGRRGGRFRPHLTIARVNQPVEMTNWVRLLDAYRGPTWTLDRVSLVASHLGEGPRGRPRYEIVEEFPLGR